VKDLLQKIISNPTATKPADALEINNYYEDTVNIEDNKSNNSSLNMRETTLSVSLLSILDQRSEESKGSEGI
jgi:hypothetical protein